MSSSSLWDNIWQKLTLTDDYIEFREYQTTWLLRLCRRFREAVALVLVKVPPLYEALVVHSEQWKGLRTLLQFLFGLFLGFLFYIVIVVDLQMDPLSTYIVGVSISLFLALGNVYSSQIRCISLLAPMRFGTATGRNVMTALIIVYLTAGPISNIIANLKEAVRVIICQMLMTFSLMKTKYELMFKPLGEALLKLRADSVENKELIETIDETVDMIKKEIVDYDETIKLKEENDAADDKRGESRRSKYIDNRYKIKPDDNNNTAVEKNYRRKLQYRCENVVSETLTKCSAAFKNAFDTCWDKLPIILNFFCYVMKIDAVCNLHTLFGGSHMCDPSNVQLPELGQTYTFLQNTKDQVKAEFQNIGFHYKVIQVPSEAKQAAQDIYEASRKVMNDFKEKRGIIEMIIVIVMRLTAFAFLFIIMSCNNYISNYLTDIEEDNIYITTYFRKIDYRRYIKGKFTLLPLKLGEKRDLSDIFALSLTTSEKAELLHSLIATILLLFFSIIFVSVDYFLYNLLLDIQTYGYIEYEQTGHHDLSMEIKGVGFLASMLRSLAHNFIIKRRTKKYVTNRECLPNPSVPGTYNFKLFGTFFLMFLLAWLNVYFLKRMNRYICSSFFPKAEKKRIIFLYNQTLKKRVTYLNYRLDIVRKQAREKKIPEPLTFFLVLRLKHPRLVSWLLYFNQGRRTCLICHEPEPKSGGENHCIHIYCYIYYCQQCWDFVVKRECIGCVKHTETPQITNV